MFKQTLPKAARWVTLGIAGAYLMAVPDIAWSNALLLAFLLGPLVIPPAEPTKTDDSLQSRLESLEKKVGDIQLARSIKR